MIEVGYMVYVQEILYMCVQGQVITILNKKISIKDFSKKHLTHLIESKYTQEKAEFNTNEHLTKTNISKRYY